MPTERFMGEVFRGRRENSILTKDGEMRLKPSAIWISLRE